ncbi:MAG TPA: hypothetical protein VIH99_04060 [Bdellovibrionota bacterium]
MSPVIYFVAHLYPWWGIPLALICAEVANSYRRHRNRRQMVIWGCFSGFLMLLALLYFVFNGLEYIRPSMKELEQSFSTK